MHSLDLFVIKSALTSFLLFAVVFFFALRWISQPAVLNWIVRIFVLVAIIHFFHAVIALRGMSPFASQTNLFAASFCLLISFVIYGLTSFLYIICIFGPFETSVRSRILRELCSCYPEGFSYQQILTKYNNRVIIQRRLDKLLCASKVSFDGQFYRLKKKMTFFSLTEFFVKQMKRWLQ